MGVEGDVASAIGGFVGDLGGATIGAAFNARSAKKQMAFQERMANTAYQRAANDLQAAGLNRVLALGSPAISPSGASASMNAPQLGASVNNARTANAGVRSAEAMIATQQEQAKNVRAQTEKTMAEKDFIAVQTRNVEADTLVKNALPALYGAQTENYFANTGKVADERQKILEEIKRIKAEIPYLEASGKKMEADAAQAQVMKMLFTLVEPLLQQGVDWFKNKARGHTSLDSPLIDTILDNDTPEKKARNRQFMNWYMNEYRK